MCIVFNAVTVITEPQLQRKKKLAKGKARAAVDEAKASLVVAGKKCKGVDPQAARYADASSSHVPHG